MKLEEAIKQTKPFKSEYQKLILNIHLTSSWLNAEFSKILKVFGITPPQYNVLRILKGKHPCGHSNQAITERMIDKSSNATRIVDKLATKALLIRNQCLDDRRGVEIIITQAGLNLIDAIDAASLDFRDKMAAFDNEKARLMNAWLEELRK